MQSSIRTTLADGGTVIVMVSGEVDYSNSDEVARRLRDAVTDWAPPAVEVDLSAATFIDSTGLGALIEGYRVATAAGVAFRVINPSETFRRVLTVTGLSDFFGLIDAGDVSARDSAASQATGT
ncbi:STAS domain-containing protein [Actinoplanes sp. NPDC023801]|uniref:STAS domain-containing protein n=1 Tax=Actinoplanes sp. NPDC023801 TaxID=3154595 RepID=UPI0033D57AA9